MNYIYLFLYRYYVYVKEGVYEEFVNVIKKMVNIIMYGDGVDKMIVIGNKNFVDGVFIFLIVIFGIYFFFLGKYYIIC